MSGDFYDSIDPAQQHDEIARRSEEDLKWLMSSPRGRRVAHRLLAMTGQFTASYVDGNPGGTAYNEGRRSVGLALLNDIRRLCPEQEFAMHIEARQ